MITMKIKILSKIALLLSLFMSLVGCNENLTEVPTDGVFNIGYDVDDIQTRAVATASEKIINEAYLLFYENGVALADQTYVAHQMVTINNSASSFPLPIPTALVPDKKYKVLIVANYDSNMPAGTAFDTFIANLNRSDRSYSSHKNELYSQTSGRLTTNLPFYGKLMEIGTDSNNEALFTCPNESTADLGVKIMFKRSVSRFDLVNNVAKKLHIESVKVCNYRDRGYFFHSDALLSTVVSGIGDNTGVIAVDNPVGNSQRVDGGMYGYPNLVSATAQGDEFTTCLMIGGFYQDPESTTPNTTKLSYYRANLAREGSPQLLKGNHVYSVVINDVTAEGSTDEGGAIVDTDNKLDYESGGDWEDGDGGTNIDDKGNFIIASRVNVVFHSDKNLSETINIKVKEGASWTYEWITPNPIIDFKAVKADGKSVTVSTTGENKTSAFTKNAKLRVKLVDVPAVFVDIDLIQLPSSDEVAMLTVDGKLGTIKVKVAGQGGELRYSILTGSSGASWTASHENSMTTWASMTQAGAHNGFFNIVFQANLTGKPRSGYVIIKRVPDVNGGVKPVRLEFTQDISSKAILIYTPQVGNIEGFRHLVSDVQTFAGGGYSYFTFSGDRQPFIPYAVTLANSEQYTWSASIDLPLLDVGLVNSSTYSVNSATKKTLSITGISGEGVYLFIQTTGPGDANINGTLTIKAIPKSGAPAVADENIPITITSSCDIDYVQIGSLIIDDRNRGPLVPAKYNEDNVHVSASYYTNEKPGENTLFKGKYYWFTELASACQSGWRAPTWSELNYVFVPPSRHSKLRPMMISEEAPNDMRYDGCFFPLSAYGYDTDGYFGTYLCSDAKGQNIVFYPTNGPQCTTYGDRGMSLRCVKNK